MNPLKTANEFILLCFFKLNVNEFCEHQKPGFSKAEMLFFFAKIASVFFADFISKQEIGMFVSIYDFCLQASPFLQLLANDVNIKLLR